MRLGIKVRRIDAAVFRWRIACVNPELADQPPAELSALAMAPYPIIEPRHQTSRSLDALKSAALNIASKQVRAGDTELFGRHLFDVLIGEPLLTRIRALGGLDSVALDSDDKDFSRIPWELLWLDKDFAARQGVGIIRIFGDPTDLVREELISPTVLFVVGSDVHDPRIRAGAEYLGLLRRLETTNLQIESSVITRASSKRITDAIERFKPAIVHFICHGGPPGSHYLELASDDSTRPFEQIGPERITELVGDIPRAIVLNACDTGEASIDSAALAWEVARKGPGVVIGMAGRIADRACRLFTRRFYEALLSGDSVEDATAAARREGLLHGSDPATTVDWAMPTLFVRDGVRLRMDPTLTAKQIARAFRAKEFRKLTDPGLICGRGECLDAHESLLDGVDAALPRALVLVVNDRSAKINNPRYGKTRALEEFAARAVLHGHIPCLVTFPSTQEAYVRPKTPLSLARALLESIQKTRRRFGLKGPLRSQVLCVLEASRTGDLSTLSVAVREQVQINPLVPEDSEPPQQVIRTALQEDLQNLAAEVRALPEIAITAKVLVLIDDLHACSQAATVLVEQWVQPHGLGSAADSLTDWRNGLGPIPLVLSYSGPNVVPDRVYQGTAERLKSLTEQSPTLFRLCELKPFPDPKEDDLPYQQFLLSRTPMLVMDGGLSPQKRSGYLNMLHQETLGVPSRFTADAGNESVHAVVRTGSVLSALATADDDELLKRIAKGSP